MGFGPSWPQNTGRGRGRRGRSQGFSLGPNRNAARTVALILLGIAAAAFSRCAPAIVEGSIDGRPRLVDGDSFFMGQTEVRMQGIDAPEGRQTCTREGRDWRCGEEAKRTLQRLTRWPTHPLRHPLNRPAWPQTGDLLLRVRRQPERRDGG